VTIIDQKEIKLVKPNVKFILAGLFTCMLVMCTTLVLAQDPLPSWNDGVAKQNIVVFVDKATKEGSNNSAGCFDMQEEGKWM
jgi:hypothetical protein